MTIPGMTFSQLGQQRGSVRKVRVEIWDTRSWCKEGQAEDKGYSGRGVCRGQSVPLVVGNKARVAVLGETQGPACFGNYKFSPRLKPHSHHEIWIFSKGPPDSEVLHPAAHLDVPWTSAAFSPSSLVQMSFLDPSRE